MLVYWVPFKVGKGLLVVGEVLTVVLVVNSKDCQSDKDSLV